MSDKNDHVLPSSADVRTTLLNLPEHGVRTKVGNWNVPIDGLKAKMGFLYMYLIAGRVSEAFGIFAPQRKHSIELKLDKEPAVMFVVKSAKRHTRRKWTLRPAVVPQDPKYEPLTRTVYDYVKEFKPNDYPFYLHHNPDTSKRYAQAYLSEIFEGQFWNFIPYLRSAFAHPALGYTFDLQRRRRKIVLEDEADKLGDKIQYDREDAGIDWVPISVMVESRWKDFASHEIRKVRLRDLERPYYFDSTDLNYYAGWESKDHILAAAAKHYLELDLDESPENIRILADMGKRYFKKLLQPIELLLDPRNLEVGGIEILG